MLSASDMNTPTFDIGSQLERLVNDQRVRIGGLIAGALVIAVSFGAVNISHAPKRATKAVLLAPEVSPNIPIIRYWPYPDQRKVEAQAQEKIAKRGVLTARR